MTIQFKKCFTAELSCAEYPTSEKMNCHLNDKKEYLTAEFSNSECSGDKFSTTEYSNAKYSTTEKYSRILVTNVFPPIASKTKLHFKISDVTCLFLFPSTKHLISDSISLFTKMSYFYMCVIGLHTQKHMMVKSERKKEIKFVISKLKFIH